MMSFDASGTIGGAVTFSKWKGRNYVRRHAIPSNPKTGGQLSTRAMMRFLTTQYAGLSGADKSGWATQGQSDNITAMNAYVRFNMKKWTQNDYPTMGPLHTGGSAPVLGALSVFGGVGQLSLTQTITTLNDGWGLYVAVSLTTGFTPVHTDVRYIAKMVAGAVNVVITGLAPNTYFVRTLGVNSTGTLPTAWVAQQSGVVT